MRADKLDSLVVQFSRLNMCGNRVGKITKFSDISSTRNVNTLAVIIERRIGGSKRWWQATVHRWINKFSTLSENEFSEMVKAKAGFLHGVRNSHCLEISAIMNHVSLAINKRIIRCCENIS